MASLHVFLEEGCTPTGRSRNCGDCQSFAKDVETAEKQAERVFGTRELVGEVLMASHPLPYASSTL